jgi:hypothetical protein
MQMIDNYLNSLESYLPEEMKQDIRDEFEASIYEQFEERQEQLKRDLTQDEQEDLLVKIGHPMQIAARYLPNQKLIGESYFPAYKRALKLAIMIVFTIKILLTLPTILSNGHIILSAFSLFWSLIDTTFWVFAYVTGIFYLMERFGFDSKYLYSFSPKDLRASNPKLSLSRVETVYELLFLVLFLGWWNNMFSWAISESFTTTFMIVSMSPEWQAVFWSVNIVIGLDVINCLYKLVSGSYNRITLIAGIILNVASVVILFQISKFSKFAAIAISDLAKLNWEKIEPIININVYIILTVILAISLWDIVSSVKKLRYFKASDQR